MSKVISLREYREAKEQALADRQFEDISQRIKNLRLMIQEYNNKITKMINEERDTKNANMDKKIPKDRQEQDLSD